jgi:hypothetical protein
VDNVHLRYEDANEANPFSLGATLQHLKVYPWRDDVTGAEAPEEDPAPAPAAGGGTAGPGPPSPVPGTDGSATDRSAPPVAPTPPQRHSRWNLKTFFKRSVRWSWDVGHTASPWQWALEIGCTFISSGFPCPPPPHPMPTLPAPPNHADCRKRKGQGVGEPGECLTAPQRPMVWAGGVPVPR